MDRFLKDNSIIGGMPLEWDDFEFDENGILDSFAGHLSGILPAINIPNSTILSGVDVTIAGPNLDISAGWIAFNGEVVKVDAHSIVDAGTGVVYWFKLDLDFDPAGNEVFEDTIPRDTYQLRRMLLTNTTLDSLPGSFMVFDRIGLKASTFRNLIGLDEWLRIDGALLTALVKINTNTTGTGTDNAPVSLGASSYFKIKIVGKTVHYDFLLDGLEIEPSSVYAANSIKIAALPGTAVDFYESQFRLEHVSFGGSTGLHKQSIASGSNTVLLNYDFHYNFAVETLLFNEDNGIAFGGASVVFSAGATVTNATINVNGSGTYEIA